MEINKWRLRFRSDFEWVCRRYLKIRDKEARLVPLVFNSAQRRVDAIYREAQSQGKRLWFIVLKARQEGVSTYFEARIFHRNGFRRYRRAVVVAHDREATNNLLDMVYLFHASLPTWLQPKIEKSNEKILSFKKLGSVIKIATAESGKRLERSANNQDVHATEVAFWRDAPDAFTALWQTASKTGDTLRVVESTANGLGGEFYDMWQEAKQGKNDYIPIFLAWFDLDTYQMPLDLGEVLEYDTDPEGPYGDEATLARDCKLFPEQMKWRRDTIRNECKGSLDRFKQEHPSNDVEAFLTTGRPVFDKDECMHQFRSATPPVVTGDLEYDDESRTSVHWVDNSKGFIKIFEKIEIDENERNRFAAGADVAEGLAQGDYSYMPVLDRKTSRIVLVWHGHIDPDLLAYEQHKIQLYLGGQIYFCTERNKDGGVVINRAYDLKVNQYFAEDFSRGWVENKDLIGSLTTESSKVFMISHLNEAIREAEFECREEAFWAECLTFVRDAKGHMSANGKRLNPGTQCFDDRVMGMSHLWRCHLWMPSVFLRRSINAPINRSDLLMQYAKKKMEQRGGPRKVSPDAF